MFDLPALAKIIIVFALVVAATAKKIHLGIAAAVGGIVLSLWHGMSPSGILGAIAEELFKGELVLLLALVASILSFSTAMRASGLMATFAKAIGIVAPSRRIAMALAPLLIGTLPMPGGAILTAPLVEAMDDTTTSEPGRLSAVNYWFRHNMEMVWPLYPAFILMSTITGFSVLRLISVNIWTFPVLFLLGLRFISPKPGQAESARWKTARGAGTKESRRKIVIEGFTPLLIVLASYISFDILWRVFAPGMPLPEGSATLIGKYAPIVGGIALGDLYIAYKARGKSAFKKSVNHETLKLLGIVAGIRIFSVLIQATGLANDAAGELTGIGVPIPVAAALLPLIAGLVTGIGFGYVGLAFPIVFSLIPAGGSFPREAATTLAASFGFAGMMLSPLHVCMVLTAGHFKTGIASTMRRFALPLSIFLSLAIVATIITASIYA